MSSRSFFFPALSAAWVAGAAASMVGDARVHSLSFDVGLAHAPAGDRMSDGVTVDVGYRLDVPGAHWTQGKATPATYAGTMAAFHGANIWSSPRMAEHFERKWVKDQLEAPKRAIYGSTLAGDVIGSLIRSVRPKVILEVGVFRGSTTIAVAKLLDSMTQRGAADLADSYIISMDSWLLDLRFAWNAPDSGRDTTTKYFRNLEVGGGSLMYWQFLANVRNSNTTHRIIPMQTASANGAVALIAHRLRPDMIYIDASHANPDVFIDYENFYTILAPGGALAFDDISVVPACKVALEALCKRYNLEPTFSSEKKTQAYVRKPTV